MQDLDDLDRCHYHGDCVIFPFDLDDGDRVGEILSGDHCLDGFLLYLENCRYPYSKARSVYVVVVNGLSVDDLWTVEDGQ